MKKKVIGIGFQKTGTSTLDVSLTSLGYKVLGVRKNLASKLFRNDIESVLKITEKFDAFQDNPWPLLYKELDKKYPNSKFILTIRDESKWINSVVNHFGKNHTEMRRWIYGVGHPAGNEEIYLKKFKNHNNEVLKYFSNRQDDLLVVEWENGDGWKKLCDFLNEPIPNQSFPHVNKGNYSKKKASKIKQAKIKAEKVLKRFFRLIVRLCET